MRQLNRLRLITTVVFLHFIAGIQAQAQYPDDEWSAFQEPVKARLQKMRELLTTNKPCKIAIARPYNPEGAIFKYKPTDELSPLDDNILGSVICIANIVVNEGTLSEKSGCALVSYNLHRAHYETISPFPRAMSSKRCDSGGLAELMSMRGRWHVGAWPDSTVENAIFTPETQSLNRFILVYADGPNSIKWFQEARGRAAEFDRKRQAEEEQSRKGEKERQLAAEKKEQEKQRAEEQREKANQRAREKQERERQKKIEEFYE